MTQPPNIIVLILDAMRARNASCYGSQRTTTPGLDRLAQESVLFEQAFSAATWTVPSHACLLTGLYLSQHRVESLRGDRHFNEAIVTLPEALRQRGYRSAAFSQNLLFSPRNHLDQGFDEFVSVDELLDAGWLGRMVQRRAANQAGPLRLAARYLRKMLAPRQLLGGIERWVRSADAGRPFFLMANLLEPHFPWTLPPARLPFGQGLTPRHLVRPDFLTLKKQWEFNAGTRAVTDEHRRIWAILYDAALRQVDRELRRFFQRLARWPGWANTIVVVTSDHGEMLGDYRGIVGHLLCLHDNLLHVPLIVRHPHYPKGLRVKGVVQTLDLFPSILEWAGVPPETVPAAQRQRPPLSRAIAQPAASEGLAFAEEDYTDSYDVIGKLLNVNPAMDPARFPRQQIAVRSATHKYIWCDDRPAELYDLVRDPLEARDLLEAAPAEAQAAHSQLDAALQDWRAGLERFPPRVDGTAPEMDAELVERLRALGYVE